MKKSLAKTLFEEGVLARAIATQDIEQGFNLAFTRANNLAENEFLETERGDVRRFKTADAVLSMADDIGFKKVEFFWG